MDKPSEKTEAPRIIDARYVLANEAREGGMSTVEKAYDIKTGMHCAIKRMKPAYDEMRGKESFHREHSALSEFVKHENVVELYDVGTDDSGFYMVLEWVPHNLSSWIDQNGIMGWSDFYAKIGRPILCTLDILQERSWSHRDIKPSNILMSSTGVPKIADFGIAKQYRNPSIGLTFNAFRSAPYTPPEDDSEQWRCSRDCFSWAAVAVYCLTGKSPTDYGDLAALVVGLDRETVPVSILEGALSHTPSERPALASALLADLDAYEAQRIAAQEKIRKCYLQFDPTGLSRMMRTLEAADRSDVERFVLSELNEVKVGWKSTASPEGAFSLFVSAVTWTFVVAPATDGNGRLVILKGWPSRPSEVERHRETGFRPVVHFTFEKPVDPRLAAQDLDRLLHDMEAHEEEDRDRLVLSQQDRVFKLWYAFLRTKVEFEERRENAIIYNRVNIRQNRISLNTELPPPLDLIGQSRVIRLTSGGHFFCDVVDVNLDEVVVTMTSGDVNRIPAWGRLEVNTIAAEKAIEHQRRALDAVNYDRAASPYLRSIIVGPSNARPPLRAAIPTTIAGGAFDPEKREILERALGLQDVLAIQGPPGTGKTRLIEEIVVQYLERNPSHRLLVSSQTHVALDNVLERVRARKPSIDMVRIGRLDDQKISPACRDLVLDYKAQAWSEGVAAKARAYLDNWAQHRGIDRRNIEIGLLIARLIRLLGQARALESTLTIAEARTRSSEARAERKLSETGSASSDEIETEAVEAEASVGDARSAINAIRLETQDIRQRLGSAGGYGPELANSSEIKELQDWSVMLLGDGDSERQCQLLLDLQEDWMLRIGRSSDFHAAMLASAQVVAGTCVGMASVRGMNQVVYDLCIIDEASKATVTEILVPMSRSRKWILVGDPAQLPPFFEDGTVTSLTEFSDDEIKQTLLGRFLAGLPDHSTARLKNQHRMVKAIGDLISEVFYDGTLVSPRIKPEVALVGAFPKPITWLTTSDLADVREVRRGVSFRNDAECRVIREILAQINYIARKRKAVYSVAVIAGYVAQVKALQDAMRDQIHEWESIRIECNTVDAFQGSEAEICIYSVTRSNVEGKLGFLKEKPRLNVALSRGRSALIIVGDDVFCRSTVGANPFRKVLDFIDQKPDMCERRTVR